MKLAVSAREVIGKKVKVLKKQGLIPCVVYGKHLMQPLMITVDKIKMVQTYHKAGKNTPIELEGDSIDQLVLIHEIQLNPVTDHLIHVDFLAVNKDEKVHAEVPLVLVGQSLFEKKNLGSIQVLRNSVIVEALPLDLPHDIKIDISALATEGEVIFLRDLTVGSKVKIIDNLDQAVLTTVAFSDEPEEVKAAPVAATPDPKAAAAAKPAAAKPAK